MWQGNLLVASDGSVPLRAFPAWNTNDADGALVAAAPELLEEVDRLRWEIRNSNKFAQDQEDTIARLRAERDAALEAHRRNVDSAQEGLRRSRGHYCPARNELMAVGDRSRAALRGEEE